MLVIDLKIGSQYDLKTFKINSIDLSFGAARVVVTVGYYHIFLHTTPFPKLRGEADFSAWDRSTLF